LTPTLTTTLTLTPTLTRTLTLTLTPPLTLSPTLTVTLTGSATRTPTLTPAKTGTPTLTRTATVTPTTPAGFSKIYPWNGATKVNAPHVTLSWKKYTGTHTFEIYRYCYDTKPGTTCDRSGGWTETFDTSVALTGLTYNTTYYWQVEAIWCAVCVPKKVDATNGGAWWSFTTGGAATPTPTKTPIRVPHKITFRSVGAQDGWVRESSETSGVGGVLNSTATTFQLGDDAINRQYKAILSFNTSSIPVGAVITSVVLKIDQSGSPTGTNPFTILGNLWVDLRKGAFGGSPALQLADFNAAPSAAKAAFFGTTPSSGWYSATLNAAGRNNINKAGVTQVRLYFATDDNNNRAADFMQFVSGNGPSNTPMLVVTYYLP